MTSQRVELVRRVFDAVNRRDVGALTELFSPKVEWHPAREDPDAGPHYGHAGLLAFLRQWLEVFDELTIDAEEIFEKAERVLVCNHYVGRGTASGVEVDDRVYQVYDFSAGKVLRVDEFYAREEALEALRRNEGRPTG